MFGVFYLNDRVLSDQRHCYMLLTSLCTLLPFLVSFLLVECWRGVVRGASSLPCTGLNGKVSSFLPLNLMLALGRYSLSRWGGFLLFLVYERYHDHERDLSWIGIWFCQVLFWCLLIWPFGFSSQLVYV